MIEKGGVEMRRGRLYFISKFAVSIKALEKIQGGK